MDLWLHRNSCDFITKTIGMHDFVVKEVYKTGCSFHGSSLVTFFFLTGQSNVVFVSIKHFGLLLANDFFCLLFLLL